MKELKFKLTIDTRTGKIKVAGMSGEVNKLGKNLKKTAKTGIVSFDKIQASIMKATAVLYSLKKALDFALEAKNAARDAIEIQSKFDTVFKGMAEQANKWADNFANSAGRANQDIKKFHSGLSDVLKPLGFATKAAHNMSKEMIKLALDVASFNNKQDDDVIRAFTSALTGERESLKTLGIVINEADVKQEAYAAGLAKLGAKLTKTAKAQATVNLLFKNSKDAQGDLLRTTESLANMEKRREATYKNMMEKFGYELIPLFKQLNKASIDFMENINQIDLGAFVGSAQVASITIIEYIRLIAETISEVVTFGIIQADKLTTHVIETVKNLINSLSNIDIMEMITGDFSQVKNKFVKEFSDGLKASTAVIDKASDESFKKIGENIDGIIGTYDKAYKSVFDKIDKERKKTKKNLKSLNDVETNSTHTITINKIDKSEAIKPVKNLDTDKIENEWNKTKEKWDNEEKLQTGLENIRKQSLLRGKLDYEQEIIQLSWKYNEMLKLAGENEEAQLELFKYYKEEKAAIDENQSQKEKEMQLEKAAMGEKQSQKEKEMLVESTANAISSFASVFDAFGKKSKAMFVLSKAFNIAEAIVNTHKSVTAALAQPFPPPIPQIDAAARFASGLASVAKISQQKFKFGGPGRILAGASHSAGGIKTPFGEFEGGEAFFTINKKSTQKYLSLLSAINEDDGASTPLSHRALAPLQYKRFEFGGAGVVSNNYNNSNNVMLEKKIEELILLQKNNNMILNDKKMSVNLNVKQGKTDPRILFREVEEGRKQNQKEGVI